MMPHDDSTSPIDWTSPTDSIPTIVSRATRWRRATLLAAAMGLVAMAGCGQPSSAKPTERHAASGARLEGDRPIRVLCTVGMVADLVRAAGGARVHVDQLMGPGVDPHLYKPTRDDVARILAADLVVHVGLMLEGRLSLTLKRMERMKPILAVGERLEPERLAQPTTPHEHPDPHLWMDVALWRECLDLIVAELTRLAPDHAEAFRANAAEYARRLDEIDAYGRKAIASIPASRRVLITSHDAFQYFGRAYGIEVQAVQGISTESEAGLRRINELVELIAMRQIRAVFIESSVPRKSLEAVLEGVRARGASVRIGGELFSDAMGEGGTYRGTYEGMMDHNLTLVARSLGGEAPARGLRGKL